MLPPLSQVNPQFFLFFFYFFINVSPFLGRSKHIIIEKMKYVLLFQKKHMETVRASQMHTRYCHHHFDGKEEPKLVNRQFYLTNCPRNLWAKIYIVHSSLGYTIVFHKLKQKQGILSRSAHRKESRLAYRVLELFNLGTKYFKRLCVCHLALEHSSRR